VSKDTFDRVWQIVCTCWPTLSTLTWSYWQHRESCGMGTVHQWWRQQMSVHPCQMNPLSEAVTLLMSSLHWWSVPIPHGSRSCQHERVHVGRVEQMCCLTLSWLRSFFSFPTIYSIVSNDVSSAFKMLSYHFLWLRGEHVEVLPIFAFITMIHPLGYERAATSLLEPDQDGCVFQHHL